MSEKTKPFNLTVPSELHAKMKSTCALENTSMRSVMIRLMENWLNSVDKPAVPKMLFTADGAFKDTPPGDSVAAKLASVLAQATSLNKRRMH